MAKPNLKAVEIAASDRLYLGLDAAAAVVDLVRHVVESQEYVDVVTGTLRMKGLSLDGVCQPGEISPHQIAIALYDVHDRLMKLKSIVEDAQLKGEAIE